MIGHQEDMQRILKDADIAVLPTYYPEGVPRFLLEAASSGLPLIASDTAPCRVVVKHGENGMQVPPRDPRALAEAIALLAADADVRRRMGSESRAIAVASFSEEKIVGEYLELYRRAFAGPPDRDPWTTLTMEMRGIFHGHRQWCVVTGFRQGWMPIKVLLRWTRCLGTASRAT